MNHLFLDFENRITRDATLRKMSLRQFLSRAPTIGFSYACNDDEPQWVDADDDGILPLDIVENLRAAALDPNVTWVAQNAAYDIRVARLQHGIPQPQHVHCSLELAMGAFPNQAGGYGLKRLAETLGLSAGKIDIDLMRACRKWPLSKATRSEIADYCKRDTALCREIHRLALPRLPEREVEIAELCNTFRELHFVIRPEKVAAALEQFATVAADSVADAMSYLDANGDEVEDTRLAFGWVRQPGTLGDDDPGIPRSVKPAKLKALLLERLGFDTKTISYKKINPQHLAGNERATQALKGTSRANKALSHKRRTEAFAGANSIDAELGFFRAHTGRFSSPSVGRGLNLHNCLSACSLILTDRGWLPIIDVTRHHRVWDGETWVNHAGVTHEGKRQCTEEFTALQMTPEHPVWIGDRMVASARITPWQRVHAAAAGCSSIMRCLRASLSWLPARFAERENNRLYTAWIGLADAVPAPIAAATDIILSDSPTHSSPSTAIDTMGLCRDIRSRVIAVSDLSDAATASIVRGGTSQHSLPHAAHCLDGMIETLTWIGGIICADMNPEISALYLRAITRVTDEAHYLLEKVNRWPSTRNVWELRISAPTIYGNEDVFDLRGAGQHGRFQAAGYIVSNCPKRDKAVARPVREMFELPEGLCFVRADEANVEYRCEGWLADCAYVRELFERDILADPYASFGYDATGVRVTKEDPSRQVYKASVLGLGFLMGIGTWISQILLLISDAANEVTLADLEAICVAQNWAPVLDQWARSQATKLHAPEAVLTVAWYMREKFHYLHPEFRILGKWLMETVTKVSSAIDPARVIDAQYRLPNAPNPDKLLLSIDGGLSGRTIRARCGPWTNTIAWRDIGLHDTKFGFCLSSIQAGNKGYRKITPNILIENVTQSVARNSICAAKLEMKRRGWNYMLSVHDELMIVCERTRESVLAARADILDVLGPGNKLGFDWAATVNPDEINVSKSLFESDMGTLLDPIGTKTVKGKEKPIYPESNIWWGRLGMGEESLLDKLP